MRRTCLALSTMVFLVAAVAPPADAATVYLLSDGKILQLDADQALQRAKVKFKAEQKADRELAAAEKAAEAAAKSEYGDPDVVNRAERLRAAKYKKKPKPIDPVAIISDGWDGAIDIETDGTWMYVLDKTSVRRFKIHGDGVKHNVAKGLHGILQIALEGGWVYLRTDSAVYRAKADGSSPKPEELSRGWGGLVGFAVYKSTVYLRMNDGSFYALRGKKWKDKLVSKGWKGIIGMHHQGAKLYLFSGGQVFRFKPGSRGTQLLDNLSSNLEQMWVRKGQLYFSGRGGRVYSASAKKGARVYQIRPLSTLIDDLTVF